MVSSTLLKFMYPPPSNLFVIAMSAIIIVLMGNGGIMELKGKHMQYSKLWNFGADQKIPTDKKAKISSKSGMILFYTPAFLVGVGSFFLVPVGDFRFDLLRSAITVHFFKRIFEVLFVHKYSGFMETDTGIAISISYFGCAATMIYSHYLTLGFPKPQTDLKYVGALLFLVGISGNFYHHYLLSKLRTKGDKKYKIPQGGLFSLVICPHYLCEIIGFIGISCISQTLYLFCFTVGSAFYLTGRSCATATRKWYQSKFEDFPTHVKALIPYLL
ncbi:very-long-chain enoyl-CoA reductase-like [Olea europaea var. sylvestris]|uniref:very-long-chain enoyl-CoA reductase-like n=1 Tax=Olea europaea var. sylvestris TaxID=158386 RepID=UPI000C1CF552|nr:very-long-chain enoyl-CoA reductase-like [Olea europaea var. sylvestris]